MEIISQHDKQGEGRDQVKQREHAGGEEHEEEEEEEVKHAISAPSPPPAAMGSPPPSSSAHQPSTHSKDDSDSPPHPVDSPTNSSLSSGHSSISRPSSPRDQAPQAERDPPSPSPPAAVVSVKRSVRDGLPPVAAMVAKADPATVDGPAVMQWAEEAPSVTMAGRGGGRGGGGGGVVGGFGGGGGGGDDGRRPRPSLSILRRARRESMVRRAQLVSRVCGCVFCLVAFSVMAADRDQGWALDSFYRYKEFRF